MKSLKLLLIGMCFWFAVHVQSAPVFIATTNFYTVQVGDSLIAAQFGNRRDCYFDEHYILYNPTHVGRSRPIGLSGTSDQTMLSNNIPMYGTIYFSALQSNQMLVSYQVSGNSPGSSNNIYAQIKPMMRAPTTMYDRFGNLTNDWIYGNESKITTYVMGDTTANTADGTPAILQYCLGGEQAAKESNYLYFNTWTNMVAIQSNAFAANIDLTFDNIHYQSGYQFVETCKRIKFLGEDTNTFTAVLDWTGSIVSTNHCYVSSISAGTILSFNIIADRQAISFDIGDAAHTNDCRMILTNLAPETTNSFLEVIQVNSIPAGNYWVFMNGVIVDTVSSATLTAGYNCWRNYNTPWWKRGLTVLDDLRTMRMIDTTNASTQTAGANALLVDYQSNARTVWATNNLGVIGYVTNTTMITKELALEGQDNVIHGHAQQQTVAIQIMPVGTFLPSPFRP